MAGALWPEWVDGNARDFLMDIELLGIDSTDDSVRDGRWELDGVEYYLRFVWVERESSWAIDMLTVDLVPIFLGAFARVGVDLLDNLAVDGRPPGRLILEDTSGTNEEIGFDGWGRTHRLVYREPRTEDA